MLLNQDYHIVQFYHENFLIKVIFTFQEENILENVGSPKKAMISCCNSLIGRIRCIWNHIVPIIAVRWVGNRIVSKISIRYIRSYWVSIAKAKKWESYGKTPTRLWIIIVVIVVIPTIIVTMITSPVVSITSSVALMITLPIISMMILSKGRNHQKHT
jgi:hypothetical protein